MKIRYSLFLLLLSSSSLFAMEFQSIGYQSMSMGGTGVAVASGAMAGYYNPALLSNPQPQGSLALGIGAGVRENNLGEQIDQLTKIGFEESLDNIAQNAQTATPINATTLQGHNQAIDRENITQGQTLLRSIGTQNGISVMPSVYLSGKMETIGFGIYGTGEISVTAHVDTERLELSLQDPDHPNIYYHYDPLSDQYQLISEEEYNQNSVKAAIQEGGTTYIDGKGLVLVEVPISYAQAYDTDQGSLSIGGSIKYMQGTTYVQRLDIETKSSDATDAVDENERKSNNVGLDLGLLFQPNTLEDLSIGLVAKNINAPSFDTANGEDITIDPQVRTGVLYQASEAVDLAVDLDLTSNETFIPGYDSQQLGMGVNYHPYQWFSLRAGVISNLADSSEGVIYTTGFGLGHERLSVDLAAQISSKSGNYDGEDIPRYARFNVALTSRW